MRVLIHGTQPSSDHLVEAIYAAAEALGLDECFAYEGRYHFRLPQSGWTLAISADSGDRIRVESCHLTQPVDRMWCLSHRLDRLAGLVRSMASVPQAT